MYVQALVIRDFKCFKKESVRFRSGTDSGSDPSVAPNVTLILGDNGAGKTTILRAIGLALLAPILRSSGYVPTNLVRIPPGRASKTRPEKATIDLEGVLHWQDLGTKKPTSAAEPLRTGARVIRKRTTEIVEPMIRSDTRTGYPNDEDLYDERSPAYFVVGYGASRRVEPIASFDSAARQKARLLRYARVAGLFEDGVTLIPLARWLPDLQRTNRGRYSQVASLINDLTPEECVFTGQVEQEYLFSFRGIEVPFSALSEGYKAYIGWISDLLYHVCMGCPPGVKLTENRGIVLLDEVDLHLHPSWQRIVIPKLARVLPHIQFIVTSHSPIVAGTLEGSNILRVHVDQRGFSHVKRSTSALHGLSADQILLSDYFGMESTRAPEALKGLRLLAAKSQEGDTDAAVAFVEHLTFGFPVTSQSRSAGGPAGRGPRSSVRKKSVKASKRIRS